MPLPHLRWRVEIGGQEDRAKLYDELFHGIAFIAEALAAELAIQAALVAVCRVQRQSLRASRRIGSTRPSPFQVVYRPSPEYLRSFSS